MAGSQLKKMGATDISKKVKDYFLEIHGPYAVFGFLIETCSKSARNDCWDIRCSFLSSMSATEAQRISYKILISTDGEIKNVTKITDK